LPLDRWFYGRLLGPHGSIAYSAAIGFALDGHVMNLQLMSHQQLTSQVFSEMSADWFPATAGFRNQDPPEMPNLILHLVCRMIHTDARGARYDA